MLEFVKERYASVKGWELYHLLCLSLFVFSMPMMGRVGLSYILGFWLGGTLVSKNSWLQLRENWQNTKAYRVFFAIAIFFVVYLFISLLYSDNQMQGLKRFESHLSLLVIPVGLLFIKPLVQKYYRFFLWAFVAGNLLACFICWGDSFLEYFTKGIWNPYYSNFSNFRHPSYFALYLAFAALFVWDTKLKHISFSKMNGTTFLYWVLVAFFSVTILFLSSKAGIFAFAGMIFSLLAIRLFTGKHLLRNSIFICLLMCASVFVLKNNQRMKNFSQSIEMIQSGESTEKWTSTNCRFHIWESALESLNGSFLLGHGIGDSRDELMKQYQKNEYDPLTQHGFDAHNQYLEILLIGGLGGLFLVLLSLGCSLFYAWKENHLLLLGFVALMGIHLMVETMFTKSHGVMFYAFFVHLLWIKMDETTSIPFVKIRWFEDLKPLRLLPSFVWRKVF